MVSTDDLLDRAATLLFIDGKWYARGRWSMGESSRFSPPCRTAREALRHLVDKGSGSDNDTTTLNSDLF